MGINSGKIISFRSEFGSKRCFHEKWQNYHIHKPVSTWNLSEWHAKYEKRS